MNSAFVGYEELSRSRRVLSTSARNILLDLLNSSYPTQPRSLIAKGLALRETLNFVSRESQCFPRQSRGKQN